MNRFFSYCYAMLAVGVLACSAVDVQAAVTTYTDRASFIAAVGPAIVETFDSYAANTPFHTVPVDVGDFTISMTGTPSQNYNFIDLAPPDTAETNVNGTTNMRVFTNNDPPADLTIAFDKPIVAFGADFRSINDEIVRTQILAAGENLVPPVQPQTEILTFYGFRSTTPFSVITFSGVRNDVYGIDDVTYRFVPEPSAVALAGVCLFGAISWRTRNRRRAN